MYNVYIKFMMYLSSNLYKQFIDDIMFVLAKSLCQCPE